MTDLPTTCGVNQIAFQLLQQQEKQHEPERLQKALIDQDEKRAHRHADKRAKERNQGRKADQHRNHRRKGKAKDQHPDKAQQPQNHRFGKLAADKAVEGLVGQPRNPYHGVRPLFRHERIGHAPRLRAQALLVGQYIQRQHHADDRVENAGHQRGRRREGAGQQ